MYSHLQCTVLKIKLKKVYYSNRHYKQEVGENFNDKCSADNCLKRDSPWKGLFSEGGRVGAVVFRRRYCHRLKFFINQNGDFYVNTVCLALGMVQ